MHYPNIHFDSWPGEVSPLFPESEDEGHRCSLFGGNICHFKFAALSHFAQVPTV